MRLLYQFQVATCSSMLEALVLVRSMFVSHLRTKPHPPSCNVSLHTSITPKTKADLYKIRILVRLRRTTTLLTPWCRDFLEKLTGLQLVKKFPAFHGTRRFITALTSVRHLSLSWAAQSSQNHITLKNCTFLYNLLPYTI